MKKYRLSAVADRVSGTAVTLLLTVLMAVLVYALRGDLISAILVGIFSLLVAAVLIFYVVNLFRTACVPDRENKALRVCGFPNETLDVSEAKYVKTLAYQSGPVETRLIVFLSGQEEVTASLQTFFMARQGTQAEPLAEALARELGLEFQPSLEPWEYDPQLRKAHNKEKAAQEKEKRRENRQALKNKILRKAAAGKPAPAPSEEKKMTETPLAEESESVNYDAMDDLK